MRLLIAPKSRRRDSLIDNRISLSGGTEDARRQLQLEVRAVPKQDRQRLLAEVGVTVEIDTTQALAIKADLAIPWYRIQILRKYVKVPLHIHIM